MSMHLEETSPTEQPSDCVICHNCNTKFLVKWDTESGTPDSFGEYEHPCPKCLETIWFECFLTFSTLGGW